MQHEHQPGTHRGCGVLRPLSRIVLLSPPVGNGNLGDEATLAAIIQNLRRRRPAVEIFVISPNPDETRIRHGVEAWPIGHIRSHVLAPPEDSTGTTAESQPLRNASLRGALKRVLKRVPPLYRLLKTVNAVPSISSGILAEARSVTASMRYLKGTDLLIMSGSGSFCDHFGGPFNFPYTIFKWSLLARIFRIPVIFPSVGVGPLQSRLSRLLVRASIAMASYRTVRDVTSQKLLDEVGVRRETRVLPDLAFSLNVSALSPRPRGDALLVGINVFPHFDPRFWPKADADKYACYVHLMTSFVGWLFSHGYRVVLFPTQVRADALVIDDVRKLLSQQYPAVAQSLCELPVRDVPDLIRVLGVVDIVVASRFHGILLSFLLERPVLGISNHHKMADLMRSIGQSEYLLDVDSLTLEALIERFSRLHYNREHVCREIAKRVAEYQLALARQYDTLFGGRSTRTEKAPDKEKKIHANQQSSKRILNDAQELARPSDD